MRRKFSGFMAVYSYGIFYSYRRPGKYQGLPFKHERPQVPIIKVPYFHLQYRHLSAGGILLHIPLVCFTGLPNVRSSGFTFVRSDYILYARARSAEGVPAGYLEPEDLR